MKQQIRPSPAQIRAARAMLDWHQPDLAKACGVSRESIAQIESGKIPGDAIEYREDYGVSGRFDQKYTLFCNLALDTKTCCLRGGGQPRKTGWGQGEGRFKGMFGRYAAFLRLSKAIMENALLKNSVYFWSNLPDTPATTPRIISHRRNG
jgi:DNA-binding XRE family transcriptional regulator